MGASSQRCFKTCCHPSAAPRKHIVIGQPNRPPGDASRKGILRTLRSVVSSRNGVRRPLIKNAEPPAQSSQSQHHFSRKTSCSRVLERFILSNDSWKGLNVRKIPFLEASPLCAAPFQESSAGQRPRFFGFHHRGGWIRGLSPPVRLG
jgi:hypothetical protein